VTPRVRHSAGCWGSSRKTPPPQAKGDRPQKWWQRVTKESRDLTPAGALTALGERQKDSGQEGEAGRRDRQKETD
jgi:hypothetical protein